MIHMGMGQEYQIDGRQFFHQKAGSALPAQHDEPLCEHRINQHLPSVHLEQKRGVANESYAEVVRFHKLYRAMRASHRLLMAFAHQTP